MDPITLALMGGTAISSIFGAKEASKTAQMNADISMLNYYAQQQAMQQALIDAAKQQFAGYTGMPQQSLGFVTQALGATATPMSTTNTRQPGLFDYLTLAASAA